MRAITLWRPWGMWIAEGLKTIETRGHDRFRCLEGERIAIHEGRHFDKEAVAVAGIAAGHTCGPEEAERIGAVLSATAEASWKSGGCLHIATADVVKVGWLHGTFDEDRAALCHTGPNRFGLWLGNVRMIDDPAPERGKQGIWTVTANGYWRSSHSVVPFGRGTR